MFSNHLTYGKEELAAVRRQSRALYWAVAVFSFFVNLLMLTGPFYMLNVYDRVLGSHSFETLLALTLLATFLFAIMGILDFARGRVMARIGARFQARLDKRVFSAVLTATKHDRAPKEAATGLRDLEAIQRLITAPVFLALFDLPWTPLFFFGIFVFHPMMGILAVLGAAALLIVALLNQITSRKPQKAANASIFASAQLGASLRNESEMVHALGMRAAAFDRWQIVRGRSLDTTIAAADTSGAYAALAKSVRFFLQSAMLGLGAYLVLKDQLSPGAMIAGSILLGRALAPFELLVGQWALFQRAREGWYNLSELLETVPPEAPRTTLPKPRARIVVDQVTAVPPDDQRAVLRMINFAVEPGQAVGVVGPSGAGKSALARLLTGVWKPAAGTIRLDGAALDQYDPDTLGQYVGYLPQRVQLFEGTIKENIARLSMTPNDARVVAAARTADAHQIILNLPDGYDTPVSSIGGRLSGGQIQRIGLARALYGDPVIVVLDEPNANLDNEGSEALNRTIRALKAGNRTVFIMTHRPSAIRECDRLLVLEDGKCRAFGPKDKVLADMVRNHADIERTRDRFGGIS